MFEYRVKITRVVDGDTVDAELDLGFNIIYKERIRLMGIDTPESRTRNKVEKKLGLKSKARLKELISIHKGNIILRTSKEGKGKFGRILGSLVISDNGVEVNLNDIMIAEGNARAYFGGSKNKLGEWTKQDPVTKIWSRWTSDGYVVIEDQ
tara:strand:- start:182 stop:634 length:453 start_codon:yes stop_codon:yes gene_type:complete